MVECIVDQGREQVMGGRDSMQVASEVQGEVREGMELSRTATGTSPFRSEDGAHGGLADGHDGAESKPSESLTETDRDGRLPFAERSRVDSRDQDIACPRSVEPGQHIERDLRLVGSIVLDFLRQKAEFIGYLADRPQLYELRSAHACTPSPGQPSRARLAATHSTTLARALKLLQWMPTIPP